MAPAKTQLTHRQRERTGNDRRGGKDVVKTSPASDSQHLLCHPRERQAANLLDGHGSGRLHCATAPARVRVPDVLLGLSFADLRLDGAPVAASGCALSRRLPGAPQPRVSPAFVRFKDGCANAGRDRAGIMISQALCSGLSSTRQAGPWIRKIPQHCFAVCVALGALSCIGPSQERRRTALTFVRDLEGEGRAGLAPTSPFGLGKMAFRGHVDNAAGDFQAVGSAAVSLLLPLQLAAVAPLHTPGRAGPSGSNGILRYTQMDRRNQLPETWSEQ